MLGCGDGDGMTFRFQPFIFLLLFLCTTTVSAGEKTYTSMHHELWEKNRHRALPERTWNGPRGPLLQTKMKSEAPIVYGFLPYWEMDYDNFHWEQLTHVAYFSAEVLPDGTIGDTHHWLKPSVEALIAEAHANGVKVTLTLTNFEKEEIAAICNSPETRASLIAETVDLVSQMNGDGVNVDFEFIPLSAKAGFVAFMSEMTEAFHEAIPGSHVSYCGHCVDWWGSYDYDLLKEACDSVFIMSYCYHGASGAPGPLAPIEGGDLFWDKDLTSTLEEYVTYGGDDIVDTIIFGLPLYGRNWPTDGPDLPGVSEGNGATLFFRNAEDLIEQYGWQWEPVSQSTYIVYQDGDQWHQAWLDSPQSIAAKTAWSREENVQGVGFWALGYDGQNEEFWELLEEELQGWNGDEVVEPDVVEGSDDDVSEESDTVEGEEGSEGAEEADTWEADAGPAEEEPDSQSSPVEPETSLPTDAETQANTDIESAPKEESGPWVSVGSPAATPAGQETASSNGASVSLVAEETSGGGCSSGRDSASSALFFGLLGLFLLVFWDQKVSWREPNT